MNRAVGGRDLLDLEEQLLLTHRVLTEYVRRHGRPDRHVDVGGRPMPLESVVRELMTEPTVEVLERTKHWVDWCRITGEDDVASVLEALASMYERAICGRDIAGPRLQLITALLRAVGHDLSTPTAAATSFQHSWDAKV